MSSPITWDIETAPRSEAYLKSVYQEPTFEEFSEKCNQHWGEEARRTNFEKMKNQNLQKFIDDAALHAETCRVCAIGVRGERGAAILGVDAATPMDADVDHDNSEESTIIQKFWSKVDAALTAKRRLIGVNIYGFDLPILCRRSFILGVPIPEGVRRGRYWNELFVDLMDVWGCGKPNFYISLNNLGGILGVGGKEKENPCDGAGFHKYWYGGKEERELAKRYLLNDLAKPWKIAEKMMLV
jgi:hypothetical protein